MLKVTFSNDGYEVLGCKQIKGGRAEFSPGQTQSGAKARIKRGDFNRI